MATTAEQIAAIRQSLYGTNTGGSGAPPALPPVKDDPAVTQARALQAKYLDDLQAARLDHRPTDIDRASNVVRVWKAAAAKLAELAADLHARRVARIEWIEKQLPVGPGIAADATAADRAVLVTAFNAALEKARASSREQRLKMLDDAERFGDDVTRRAVLTASIDDSQWDVVNRWTGVASPETGDLIKEWMHLRKLFTGQDTTDHGFQWQAFRALPRPPEWHDLPRLVQAHNQQVQNHNRSQSQVRNGQTRSDLIDLGDLLTPPPGYRGIA